MALAPDAPRAAVVDGQRQHWASTFAGHPDMYGTQPSRPAVAAADLFVASGARRVLELGAGQGRDTLLLAHAGLSVVALDYVAGGLDRIRARAGAEGVAARVDLVQHDVRDRLPFADGVFDASYSHMLFCMALSTPELDRLAAELRRVVRPGGLVVYTVRHTGDAHFGAGVARGDGMFEHGGFVVHFFDRPLVERLARGFELLDVDELTEGELPRRLWQVTMRNGPEGGDVQDGDGPA